MEDKDIEIIEEFNYNFLSATRIGLDFPVTMYIKDDTHNSIMKLLQAYKQDEKVIKEAREFIENKMEYLKKCRTFKVVFYDEENMKHEWNEHLLYKENERLKGMLKNRIKYTQELEKDLFENCSNYVVPKQVIRDKLEELEEDNYDGEQYQLEIQGKIELLKELLGE